MPNLDSVKLKAPPDCIRNISKTNLLKAELSKGDTDLGVRYKTDRSSALSEGVKSIALDGGGNILVELSAKVLGDNYHKLINLDTIEQTVNAIDNLWLSLDTNKFIETAEVLRCDCSNDLTVSQPINEYLARLGSYGCNPKYIVTPYPDQGVVFRNQAKSYKERQIYYGKYKDVVKDKPIVKAYGGVKQLRTCFGKKLRVEQNITSHKRIRDKFAIDNIGLLSILNSQEKPNYDLFNKITDIENPALEIYSRYGDRKLLEIKKEWGVRGIIRLFGFDLDLVKEFLKYKKGSDWSREWRVFKGIYDMMYLEGEIPGVEAVE
ncbi:unnamed protein product, partial [marine sediment metagenome]